MIEDILREKIRECKPSSILELGVGDGKYGEIIVKEALTLITEKNNIGYYGYDNFQNNIYSVYNKISKLAPWRDLRTHIYEKSPMQGLKSLCWVNSYGSGNGILGRIKFILMHPVFSLEESTQAFFYCKRLLNKKNGIMLFSDKYEYLIDEMEIIPQFKFQQLGHGLIQFNFQFPTEKDRKRQMEL